MLGILESERRKMVMLNKCKYDWDTETVSFTFNSQGSKLSNLDAIKDMQVALQNLYDKVMNEEHDAIAYQVVGGNYVKSII